MEHHMNEWVKAWLILIALISVVGGAYLLAWRGKLSTSRRWGAWTVSLVSALGAVVATSYAIGELEDFQVMSFWMALVGNLIIWAICIGAWAIAIRFTIISSRKGPAR
jgi:hypothetical protein